MGSSSSSNVRPFGIPKETASYPSTSTEAQVESFLSPATDTGTDSGPGAGVSKRVSTKCMPMTIEVAESSTNRPRSNRTHGETLVMAVTDKEDVQHVKSKLAEIKKERDELKAQNKQLEQQMGELESHNLDLAERVQVLEEQLETEHQTVLISTETPCVNTVKAKDQCIAKLEKETATVQEEIRKLKAKYKKKIRQMNGQLSEAKHESSLTMFETKEELQRLRLENAELLRKAKVISIREEGDYPERLGVTSKSMGDRTSLILDLSTQVSAQEKTIMELELTIQDRDKMINELVQSEKPRGGSSKGKRGGSGRRNVLFEAVSREQSMDNENWSVDVVDAQSAPRLSTDKVDKPGLQPTRNSAQSSELSEMQAMAREMKQAQRKKTKKKNLLKDRVNVSPPVATAAPDSRQSSGTSRDSGIASGDSDVHVHKTRPHWMNSQPSDAGFDLLNTAEEEDNDGLELQSFCGTPSQTQTQQHPSSPENMVSGWSDNDDRTDLEGERRSNISVSSIRRISAPKKKKKHALSDHNLLVDNLLNDLDQPLRRTALSKTKGIHTREGIHEFSLCSPLPVTSH